MKILSEFKEKNLELKNRLVMPPMCMYSATDDGYPVDFHYVHYVSRAAGGAGLIIQEATAVSPEGRISGHDLGLWEDGQIQPLKKIVDGCHSYGAKVAVQLAHAGRKCEVAGVHPFAPSPISHEKDGKLPVPMTKQDIQKVIADFREAAVRADKAGYDAVEIHGAHGYLIHEFLSPLSNFRTDEYGGSRENRVRLLKEILTAVREVWPAHKTIILRVSASDYLEGGIDKEQMGEIVGDVRELIDILHVSSGGLLPAHIHTYPGYQAEMASYLKAVCHVPTIAVGLIKTAEVAEEILENGRADLVAVGRELLANPYWLLQNAHKAGEKGGWPTQYDRAFI